MNSRERVISSINRKGYDRIPVKHEGTPEINHMIMKHFGLTNMEQLLRVVGDDFRYVAPIYCGPELRKFPDGSIEGYFGERYNYVEFDGGKYLESVYQPYAGINSLDKLDCSQMIILFILRLWMPALNSIMRCTGGFLKKPMD